MSTLGGNIVRVFAWADFPVALLALGATMIIQGDEARRVAADEFFNGQPVRLLKTGDLLVGVQIPALSAGPGFWLPQADPRVGRFQPGHGGGLLEVDGRKIKAPAWLWARP
jgi:hypothetical protein